MTKLCVWSQCGRTWFCITGPSGVHRREGSHIDQNRPLIMVSVFTILGSRESNPFVPHVQILFTQEKKGWDHQRLGPLYLRAPQQLHGLPLQYGCPRPQALYEALHAPLDAMLLKETTPVILHAITLCAFVLGPIDLYRPCYADSFNTERLNLLLTTYRDFGDFK